MKLMRKYKEAPTWWYMSLFVIVCASQILSPLSLETKLTTQTMKDVGSRSPYHSCLADKPDVVGFLTGCPHLHCVFPSHWNHSGCHQQPDRAQCPDRIHLRIYPARTTAGAHDVSLTWLSAPSRSSNKGCVCSFVGDTFGSSPPLPFRDPCLYPRSFKTFGYITMSQALSFVSDLKFGHYMKIPPRTMFMAQVVATTFSCFIQIVVLNFALNNVKGVCTPTQPEHFTCPGGKVFFSGTSMPHHLDPILVICLTHPHSFCHLGSHWPCSHLLAWPSLLGLVHFLHRRSHYACGLLPRRQEVAQVSH